MGWSAKGVASEETKRRRGKGGGGKQTGVFFHRDLDITQAVSLLRLRLFRPDDFSRCRPTGFIVLVRLDKHLGGLRKGHVTRNVNKLYISFQLIHLI